MKVYRLENDKDAILADNVESGWRGVIIFIKVQDLSFNDNDKVLYGITSDKGNFSLWGTSLETINKKDTHNK